MMFTVYAQFTDLSSGSINTNWQAVGFETHLLHSDESLVL